MYASQDDAQAALVSLSFEIQCAFFESRDQQFGHEGGSAFIEIGEVGAVTLVEVVVCFQERRSGEDGDWLENWMGAVDGGEGGGGGGGCGRGTFMILETRRYTRRRRPVGEHTVE